MIASIAVAMIPFVAVVATPKDAMNTDPHDPVACPEAVVTMGHARFTVLTPQLVRLEYAVDGKFEDRASLAFVNRKTDVPNLQVDRRDDGLTLRTDKLQLFYADDGKSFHAGNLSTTLTLNGEPVTWRPGMKDAGNLLGTCRTLDGVSGASALEPGLISRDGWVLVDDSERLLFDTSGGRPWAAPRRGKGDLDWYFFGHGHDYKQALSDFTLVAGRIPIPPRWAFGAWWSRYWAYSDKDLKQLVREFDEHDVPLDVLVVDMDWHLDGWTGYTWNPDYFPDYKGFLDWAHEQGLKVTLNLHPADGVGKQEQQFPAMAKAMGVDPKKVERIPFDCTAPRFVDAYFKLLHHPYEKDGVDFWWIDWQQGTETKIAGLDPLFWLNYLHWDDMARRADETGKRPMIFSRWGGLGNHRYPIGFSGDTFCNWSSLAFQPYFTATAGNVGFAYWSHDIGGHQPGPVDPELYARWIQFGVFSPILRTHTTKNPKAERRIWEFPPEVFDAAREAFHLRSELIPYIYSAAWECYETGLSLCRPLYLEWPEIEESYTHPGEYMFGDALLVAPVVEPADPVSGCAQVSVWLPPGEWRHWFTGRRYIGPRDIKLLVPLDDIPLFVRDGMLIPASRQSLHAGARVPDPLIVYAAQPCNDDEHPVWLYEDDGIAPIDKQPEGALRALAGTLPDESARTVNVTCAVMPDCSKPPDDGVFFGDAPKHRGYELKVRDVWPPREVRLQQLTASGADGSTSPEWRYDVDSLTATVRADGVPFGSGVGFTISPHPGQTDTTLLANGLRGQLQLLADITKWLGDRTPGSIRQVEDVKEQVRQRPESAAALMQYVPDHWLNFIDDVADLHIDESLKRRILIRLLGLVVDLRVVADAERPGELLVRFDVTPTMKIAGAKDLAGTFSLAVSEPWTTTGEAERRISGLSEDKPLATSFRLANDGTPQTGIVTANLTVRKGKTEFAVPIERVFLPSINAWWLLGPFEGKGAGTLAHVYPPEQKIDLAATYKGKAGKKIRWQRRQRTLKPGDNLTEEFFIDFDDIFGGRVYDATVYALACLESPADMDAVLAVGSDDGVVVWLNDKELHRNNVGRPYSPKQDRVPVKLNKGVNKLLLKINQGGGDWAFAAHMESPDGRPLPQVLTVTKMPDGNQPPRTP